MKDVVIRPLEQTDANAIRDIYAEITQQPVHAGFKQLIRQHAARVEDICFVAEYKGRVIGFMVTYILTLGFGIEKSAWIATLGVKPEFMGQEVGRNLAQQVFAYYKKMGIENVYTSVRWDSPDLLSFFKTLGFDRSNFVNLRKRI